MQEHNPISLSGSWKEPGSSATASHLAEYNHVSDKEQAFTIIYRASLNRSRLVRFRLVSIAEAIGIQLLDPQLCVQKKVMRPLNLNWPAKNPSPQACLTLTNHREDVHRRHRRKLLRTRSSFILDCFIHPFIGAYKRPTRTYIPGFKDAFKFVSRFQRRVSESFIKAGRHKEVMKLIGETMRRTLVGLQNPSVQIATVENLQIRNMKATQFSSSKRKRMRRFNQMARFVVCFALLLGLVFTCEHNGNHTHEKLHHLIDCLEIRSPHMDTVCSRSENKTMVCHTKGKNFTKYFKSVLRAMTKIMLHVIHEVDD
ncbi:hypothetical protein CLF_107040 [Clonorchis sinensis]|uniref:Uncharacterized protein n=1 Tax=Clonorchis sinensis TaxID=79923 RepID=H2KU00_CLOSI|nr:hypothetical protein CLF_107040 [Clonorchis sinensis]